MVEMVDLVELVELVDLVDLVDRVVWLSQEREGRQRKLGIPGRFDR